jgi:glutaredoxin
MNRLTKLLLMVCMLGVVGAAGAAKLYKWIDKDGNVSYQDRPPPEGGQYKVEEKNLRTGADSIDNPALREAAEKNPVVLYVAPKCASCDAARAFLQGRKIPFRERNVDGNRELQQELIARSGGLAVPTITIGEKIMRGFLESLLEGELDSAGYPKPEAEQAQQGGEEIPKQQ